MARFLTYTKTYNNIKCPYCANNMLLSDEDIIKATFGIISDFYPTKDHVIPKSSYIVDPYIKGKGIFTLIVCRKCNNDKGDLFIQEWLYILHSQGDERVKVIQELIKTKSFKRGIKRTSSHIFKWKRQPNVLSY